MFINLIEYLSILYKIERHDRWSCFENTITMNCTHQILPEALGMMMETIFLISDDVDIKHVGEFMLETTRRTQFKSNYIEIECISWKYMRNISFNKYLENWLYLQSIQTIESFQMKHDKLAMHCGCERYNLSKMFHNCSLWMASFK